MTTQRRLAGALAVIGALCAPVLACAATLNEDAGDTLATARPVDISNPTAVGGIVSVPDDADLFRIALTAGTLFTAQSAAGSPGAPIADTQLFLFDASGRGVRYNDDLDVTDFYSRIAFTPTSSGTYYLGISAVGFNPREPGGNFIYMRDPFDPADQQGASPAGALASWAADGSGLTDTGAYRIDVAGVSPVPEPTTLAALLSGLLLLAARRFKSKK